MAAKTTKDGGAKPATKSTSTKAPAAPTKPRASKPAGKGK
jgi:hypothetical protein